MRKCSTFYLFALFALFCSCKQSAALDIGKLDRDYFIGDYEVDYHGEVERITLKPDSSFDYAYGVSRDTVIKNAGKWGIGEKIIILYGFPSLRKEAVFEGGEVNMMLNVNTHIEDEFGDLSILINGGEDNFTFVKLDKGKNRYYLLKKREP